MVEKLILQNIFGGTILKIWSHCVLRTSSPQQKRSIFWKLLSIAQFFGKILWSRFPNLKLSRTGRPVMWMMRRPLLRSKYSSNSILPTPILIPTIYFAGCSAIEASIPQEATFLARVLRGNSRNDSFQFCLDSKRFALCAGNGSVCQL